MFKLYVESVVLAGRAEIGASAESINSVVPSVTENCCGSKEALASVGIARGMSSCPCRSAAVGTTALCSRRIPCSKISVTRSSPNANNPQPN